MVLIIDKKFNFNEQIDYLYKKVDKKISFFKRIRSKISKSTAINIYSTISKPYFEYGSTILFTCTSTNQLERMQKLQNRAMRIILKCDCYTYLNTLLNNLKWISIAQRLQFNTLRFVRKLKQGDAPKYLCDRIHYEGDSQPYPLRNTYDFRIQRVRSRLFSSLPNNIKNETNENLLRRKCTNSILFNNL